MEKELNIQLSIQSSDGLYIGPSYIVDVESEDDLARILASLELQGYVPKEIRIPGLG